MNDNPIKEYQIAILRYCPDAFSGEFANVGVLLYVPEDRTLEYKNISNSKRVDNFFISHSSNYFKDYLSEFLKKFDEIKSAVQDILLFDSLKNINRTYSIGDITSRILSIKDINFHWSPIIRGQSTNPISVFRFYVQRLLSKNKPKSVRGSRLQTKIKNALKESISADRINKIFIETSIGMQGYDLSINHYQNKTLLIIPMDLRNGDTKDIQDKILQIYGGIQIISDSSLYAVDTIVSPPSESEYEKFQTYRRALNHLLSELKIGIIEEKDLPIYTKKVAEEMASGYL